MAKYIRPVQNLDFRNHFATNTRKPGNELLPQAY